MLASIRRTQVYHPALFRRLRQAVKGKGRVLLVAAVGVLGLAAAVAASHAATVVADLIKVRLGGDASQTRIVVDLDHAASGRVVADGAGDRRVLILLAGASTTGRKAPGPAW